jgi:hypothetical protein
LHFSLDLFERLLHDPAFIDQAFFLVFTHTRRFVTRMAPDAPPVSTDSAAASASSSFSSSARSGTGSGPGSASQSASAAAAGAGAAGPSSMARYFQTHFPEWNLRPNASAIRSIQQVFKGECLFVHLGVEFPLLCSNVDICGMRFVSQYLQINRQFFVGSDIFATQMFLAHAGPQAERRIYVFPSPSQRRLPNFLLAR